MDVSLLTSPQAKHQRMYRGTSIYSEASQVDLERSTHKASAIVVSPDDSSDYDSSFVKGLLEKERRQMLDEQRSSFKGVKVRSWDDSRLDARGWTTSPHLSVEIGFFSGGAP